jgi:hypothetical protein
MGTFCMCFCSYALFFALLHKNGNRFFMIPGVTSFKGEVLKTQSIVGASVVRFSVLQVGRCTLWEIVTNSR